MPGQLFAEILDAPNTKGLRKTTIQRGFYEIFPVIKKDTKNFVSFVSFVSLCEMKSNLIWRSRSTRTIGIVIQIKYKAKAQSV